MRVSWEAEKAMRENKEMLVKWDRAELLELSL